MNRFSKIGRTIRGYRLGSRVPGLSALVLICLLVSSSSARAEIPQPIDCAELSNYYTGYVGPGAQVQFPKSKLAINRVAWTGIAYYYDSDEYETRDLNISFSSAYGSRPISRPFSRNLSKDEGEAGVRIQFETGDGPGRISVSWTQFYPTLDVYSDDGVTTHTDIQCTRERSRIVQPVKGIVPGFLWDFSYIGVQGTQQLSGNYGPKSNYCRQKAARQQTAPGVMILRVAGGGSRTRINMGEICGQNRSSSRQRKFWKLYASGSNFNLTPKWRKPGSRVVRLSANLGSLPALRARVRFTTIHKKYRQIWEGTDAFINVCINGLIQINSSGGRLYCGVGGRTYTEFKILKWDTSPD